MARARVGSGIELEYDVLGTDGPALVLIAGLGAQLVSWPPPFSSALADRFRVVVFDNRDAGRSTILHHLGPVPPGAARAAVDGEPVPAPYELAGMAGDVIGLLDLLGMASVHVVGASMGGMIAQHLAFGHPDRVRSLTSIMSTTGHPDVGGRTEAGRRVLLTPLPTSSKGLYVAASVEAQRILGSPTLFDEEWAREKASRYWDRGIHPRGTARQLLAIHADGDRTDRLRRIVAPTLVIHGRHDPLIAMSGGEATAAAVPIAELVVFDEMAHDLPLPLCGEIADRIARHVDAAEQLKRQAG